MKHHIDYLDKQILSQITQNARIPFLEVARECKVSGAAIHQRVQKLIAVGVIQGSQMILDTHKIGYHTCAMIGITIPDSKFVSTIITELERIPEIVSCDFATGHFSMVTKVYAHDNRHLLDIIVNKISTIEGVGSAETIYMALDEAFSRPLSTFKNDDEWEEY